MQKLSAKNIILIAVAAAIVGAAFIVSKYENLAYANIPKNSLQNSLQLPTITATTADAGVAYSGNWQKTLSGAVAGVWGASGNAATSSSNSNQQLTPTEQFSRNIFSQYVQAQNSGEEVTDPNVQQGIAGQVLSDGTVLPAPGIYAIKDIKIENNNGSSAMQQYGNAIGAILENDQSGIPGYETDIVQNAMNSNDPTMLKQLDPFIASYQKMINDLLATPVPSNMASLHVAVINAVNELLFADQGFEKIYTDALTGLAATSAYKQGIHDLPIALVNVKKYFVVNNITFDPKGPGSVFNTK